MTKIVTILATVFIVIGVVYTVNTDENETLIIQEVNEKDDLPIEKVVMNKPLKEKKIIKKEKTKASEKRKVIKGYTQAYEYIYKKEMKQIVDDVQFTQNNTPYTIYSDGGDIQESKTTPPMTPISVTTSLEDGPVSFFVPSNATEVALLVSNGDEQSLIVEPVGSENDNIQPSPAPPQVLFSSGDAVQKTEDVMPEAGKTIF